MRRPHLLARYMRTCRDAVLRSRWTGDSVDDRRFYIGRRAVVRGDEHVQSVVHRPGDVRKSHTILVNLDRAERIGNVQFFFRVESPSIGKTDFAVIDFYNHCPEEAQSPELRRALGFCVVVRNGDMAPPGQRCCLLLTELSTKMSYLAHDGLLYCAHDAAPPCPGGAHCKNWQLSGPHYREKTGLKNLQKCLRREAGAAPDFVAPPGTPDWAVDAARNEHTLRHLTHTGTWEQTARWLKKRQRVRSGRQRLFDAVLNRLQHTIIGMGDGCIAHWAKGHPPSPEGERFFERGMSRGDVIISVPEFNTSQVSAWGCCGGY